MKQLILAAVALGLTGTALAVNQGVYTASEGRRVVFSYYEDDGNIVYSMSISNHQGTPITKNGILYHSLNPKKPVAGNDYTFRQISPYYDEEHKSKCLISAKWKQNGVLELSTGNSCSKLEKAAYPGRYTYTDKMVFPAKFRGSWGVSCKPDLAGERLRIGKDWFTHFQDFGGAQIISVYEVNGVSVFYGIESSEGAFAPSVLMIKPLGKDKLEVAGEHHADRFKMTVRKCSAKP